MKSNRVALVLSEINTYRLIPGIHRIAALGRDYWLIDIYRPLDELKQLLKQWKPVGLILEWMPEVSPELLDLGIPTVVSVKNMEPGGPPSVDVDDDRVGQLAAHHLIGLDLRHFAFLGEPMPYAHERCEAFSRTLREHGFDCEVYFEPPRAHRKYIEHWHESDSRLIRWLKALPKPVGIFAAHDPSGRLLAECCHQIGILIPDQVAIIGANNDHHVCGMTYPPLSSIEIPWDMIGYESAKLMEEILRDKSSSRLSRPPLLIPPTRVVSRRSSDFLSVSSPVLSRALEYIRENATEGITVKDVIDTLHVSRRSLEREIRQMLNRSLHEEIIRQRIEHAKRLLAHQDIPIDEVAELSGFSRVERLSVNFRKLEQCTPSAFRRMSRTGSPVGTRT